MRQMELSLRFEMALEAGGCILARVHDEFAAPAADLNVFAAGTMAGFAAALIGPAGAGEMDAAVRTGRELADVVGVAIEARRVANETGPGHFRRNQHGARRGGAGIGEGQEEKGQRAPPPG